MKEFSNIAGYKINTHKSILFLYTGSEQSKNEIKKQNNTIYNSSKKLKILWNTFIYNKSKFKKTMLLYMSKLKHETISYLQTTVKSIKTCKGIINTIFRRMSLLGREGRERFP